jgi:hypothetical protein
MASRRPNASSFAVTGPEPQPNASQPPRWAVWYNFSDDLCRCDALLVRLFFLTIPPRPPSTYRTPRLCQPLRKRRTPAPLLPRGLRTSTASRGLPPSHCRSRGRHPPRRHLRLRKILHRPPPRPRRNLLAAGDARKALQNARDALDRSEHPDCAYAWGQADGLHFCGVAHRLLGERELARQRLTAALELRERLGHGRIEETRRALDSCRP